MARPSRVEWSDHALLRAAELATPLTDVEALLLAGHERRERNRGSAPWRVRGRGLVVLYDWPTDGDEGVARLVTLWSED